MLYIVLGLAILCLVLVVYAVATTSIIRARKKEYEKLERINYGLERELEKVTGIQKIKEENQKDADEKINELLNGDSVGNAIDILCKH